MAHKNLDDLILSSKDNPNPFNYVGVDELVLRSMSPSKLKLYLGDFRRLFAKYNHPDKFTDPIEKAKQESYFQLVSSAIDKLLSDDFYFRQSLDDFRSGNTLRRYQRKIDVGEDHLELVKKQIKVVSDELLGYKSYVKSRNDVMNNSAKSAFALWNSKEAVHLVPGLKCLISYVHLDDYNYTFTYGVNNIINSSVNPLEVNLRGKKFAEKIIGEKYSSLKERLAERERRKKERKQGLKPKSLDKEKTRMHEGYYVDGREFVPLPLGNPKNPVIRPYFIIGSIPYSSVLGYFDFNGKKIMKPEYLTFKDSMNQPFSAITREFFFDDSLGPVQTQERLDAIMPFTSQLIMPYVPLFLKEFVPSHDSGSNKYQLIIPTKVTRL